MIRRRLGRMRRRLGLESWGCLLGFDSRWVLGVKAERELGPIRGFPKSSKKARTLILVKQFI